MKNFKKGKVIFYEFIAIFDKSNVWVCVTVIFKVRIKMSDFVKNDIVEDVAHV